MDKGEVLFQLFLIIKEVFRLVFDHLFCYANLIIYQIYRNYSLTTIFCF